MWDGPPSRSHAALALAAAAAHETTPPHARSERGDAVGTPAAPGSIRSQVSQVSPPHTLTGSPPVKLMRLAWEGGCGDIPAHEVLQAYHDAVPSPALAAPPPPSDAVLLQRQPLSAAAAAKLEAAMALVNRGDSVRGFEMAFGRNAEASAELRVALLERADVHVLPKLPVRLGSMVVDFVVSQLRRAEPWQHATLPPLLGWLERALALRRRGASEIVSGMTSGLLEPMLRDLSASDEPAVGIHAAKLFALLGSMPIQSSGTVDHSVQSPGAPGARTGTRSARPSPRLSFGGARTAAPQAWSPHLD
jgi:hypothetical protein